MIKERLNKLRNKMKEHNIQAYIVCTDDYHGSEYVGEYFKERAFLSGFTGSAGTVIVLMDKAALWTDGRYFLQAEEQLQGSGIDLMKMGNEGVPSIAEYMQKELMPEATIGFDGRTVTTAFVKNITDTLGDKKVSLCWDVDLVGEIWQKRPEMSCEPIWEIGTEYTGKSRVEKFKEVRQKMKEVSANIFILTALDDIAWLLNLRGNDVACNPVFLSYMLIKNEGAVLYVQKKAVSDHICKELTDEGIVIKEYDEVYADMKQVKQDDMILLDTNKVNYTLLKCIPKGIEVVNKTNPTVFLKAVKNATEYSHIRNAHIKDGVAVTRFMYWLKHAIGKEAITEIGASEKLEKLRKEQDGYLGPSFEPIMAYGAHGAIVHYSATTESNAVLEAKSFFLCDTGGQYLEGTTDVTRTYALGKLTDEQKRDYTLVLKGNLNLAAAKFMHGVRGVNLDYLARSPLWEYGLDYNHGTGHGVGCLLNVHEAPNAFRWRLMANNDQNAVLEEGMVTSNEPGVYITDKFGIRLENLILCKKAEKTEYGQFMCFETLTMVPFDIDAIDVNYLDERDIRLLNEYHAKVYKIIAPYLNDDERKWLCEATRALSK